MVVMVVGVTVTIVLIRNHYSIDVWLAMVLTNVVWAMYGLMSDLLSLRHPQLLGSVMGRALMWLQGRGREPSDEVDVSSSISSESEIVQLVVARPLT